MSAATPGTSRRPVLPVPALVAIAGGFALLYAYAVWTAVGFLIAAATGANGLSGSGWALLLAAVVFPVVVYAGAFAVGWRRRAGAFALILLTGLGITAVFWMNVVSFASTSSSLIAG